MQNMPKITIVTPSFNQAKFIRKTIESIISQNYSNLEYFVVDGGSTDKSTEIIRDYEHHIDWWVSEKDDGQSDALNKGFAKATGDLVAWVNSDDILLPNCLNYVANWYRRKDHPDIITTNVLYIDSQDLIMRCKRIPCQTPGFFFHGMWYAQAPTVFFRKIIFDKVGCLNPELKLSMDLDLWIKMMKKKAMVAHIPKYLGAFRLHQSTKTMISLQKRKTRENPETTLILNNNLLNSNPSKRKLWTYVYKLYQIINLNYLREFIDWLLVKGKSWEDTARFYS